MGGRHLVYLAVLVGCLLGTLPLELVLHVRVYARWRRLLATLVPVLVVFLAWDVYAIGRHQWSYDLAQMLGVVLPGNLPLEELLFFLVVPVCAILCLEAVATVRGWAIDCRAEPDSTAEPDESPTAQVPR